jgi:hypothetical protein
MNNNHIGTAFQIFKEIADELGWNYSHGTLDEHSLKAITVYPLLHVTMQNASLTDVTEQFNFNILIADITNYLKGENEQQDLVDVYSEIGYTENQNYAHILQNLYVEFSRLVYAKEKEYYSQIQWIRPISFTPFTEGGQDVLTGYNVSITIELQNPWVTDGTCY